MWKTRITEMLGIRYPIIQGAFAGFGTSALAAPVSEAGGLGMITATALRTPEGLRQDIRRAKSITDKPFGVNLTMFGSPNIEEMREVVIEEGVPVVETAAYRADMHGKRLQERGVKWIHKVATVKHALAAEEQGVDAVVMVGLEGAGFKSALQLPTLISVTWACRQLKIPVIAAGAIADGRGLMAALAMGAEGVYMGTAFMATKECPISERHKMSMIRADPTEPKYRERCLAPPKPDELARVMQERGSMPEHEWLFRLERAMLKEAPDISLSADFDLEEEVLRSLPGSLAVALIDKVVSVRELIESIMAEAEVIRRRWALM
jgi:NAD(P)H-dependent flavin oxidoreductase YrpB (nitropropane dioxygenase family)